MLTVNPSRKVLGNGREEGAVDETKVSIHMMNYMVMAMATVLPKLLYRLRRHASLEEASPYSWEVSRIPRGLPG